MLKYAAGSSPQPHQTPEVTLRKSARRDDLVYVSDGNTMTPIAQAVLASMLFILAPGQSPYSLVKVDACDAQCQKTPLCKPASKLLCRPPFWSGHHKSFVRMENYQEGLERYATVAKVVAALSESMAWEKIPGCKPYGKTDDFQCKLLRQARPWTGPSAELRRILLASMYRESGFRRDIHSGVGPMARGDCKTDAHGQRIPGSCRSHCLGQVLIDRRKGTPVDGFMPDDLVGVDLPATGRCITATIRELSQARSHCLASARTRPIHISTCVFMVYVGTSSSTDGRIRARIKTWRDLGNAPGALSVEVKTLLGLEPQHGEQPAAVATPFIVREVAYVSEETVQE